MIQSTVHEHCRAGFTRCCAISNGIPSHHWDSFTWAECSLLHPSCPILVLLAMTSILSGDNQMFYNAVERTCQVRYSQQLADFIRRYKTRPQDIKFWPYGPYWPTQYFGPLHATPRHNRTVPKFDEPLYTHSQLGRYSLYCKECLLELLHPSGVGFMYAARVCRKYWKELNATWFLGMEYRKLCPTKERLAMSLCNRRILLVLS